MNTASIQSAVCTHCGSAITTPYYGPSSEVFCCSGCQFVYQIMGVKGLTKFYSLRDANPPACPVPVNVATGDFSYFDDPEFLKTTSANGTRVRFFLEGMNCTACIWLLEKLPDFCPDAASARVDLAASTIEVTRQPNGSFAAIAATLNQLGYRPHPLREDENSKDLQNRERRRDLIRIGTAAALTGNIMIMTVSLYGGADGELERLFQWLTAVLATPVLTYCAWPFYQSAFSSVRMRRLNLDVPIVVAIFAGVITSAWALWQQTSLIYFDSLSMLVFLLLSSRFFLRGIQSRNLQATNVEDDLMIGSVKLVCAEGFRDVSASSLKRDDCVVLQPGRLIPVDGVIESGFATVSAAVLTGESTHLHVSKGSAIEAGYRNLLGSAVLRVVNPTRQTRLAGILRETQRLAEKKSDFVQFADKAAQYFIAIVFLAAAMLVITFARTDLSEGVTRALALVIVTCPCVFGIAIPLSMAIAIRKAAQRGAIVKSGRAIEQLWKAKIFFFDKTATLTTGAMHVVRASFTDLEDLKIVHGLEKNQLHPVARALTSYTQTLNAGSTAIQDVEVLSTGGVSGTYQGARYTVRPVNLNSSQKSSELVSRFELVKNGTFVSDFDLQDQPREEAEIVLENLRSQGARTFLLSGDRKPVVDACARSLGFTNDEAYSQMTPESKALKIQDFAETSVMIGDGANDAAAFAAAGVGIAVCGSLDASLRAADVYLTRPSLNTILDLVEIARDAKFAIYRNLVFSAGFNVVAGTLAAMGKMSPLWAAIIMPLSSVTVLLSANWSRNR